MGANVPDLGLQVLVLLGQALIAPHSLIRFLRLRSPGVLLALVQLLL